MISFNLKKIGCVLSASAMLFYAAAALPVTAAEQTTEKNWKKAQLSAYDTSLSLVQYQEVDEAAAEKMQTVSVGQQHQVQLVQAEQMLRFLWLPMWNQGNLLLPHMDMVMAAV